MFRATDQDPSLGHFIARKEAQSDTPAPPLAGATDTRTPFAPAQRWGKNWNNPDDGLGPLIEPQVPGSIRAENAAICILEQATRLAGLHAEGHEAAAYRAAAAQLLAKADQLAPPAPPLAGATGEGEAFTPTRVLNRALNRRFGFAEDGPIPWHNMTPKVVYDVALDCLKGVEGQLLDGEARAEAAEAEATALRTRLQEAEEAGAGQRLLADAMRENLESYRLLLPKADERYAAEVAAHAETSAAYTGALKEWKEAAGNCDRLLRERNAAQADNAALRAKLATEGEQERELLKRDKEWQKLHRAILVASSGRLSVDEREAYASNTNGQGTRGAFGAGEIMGRVSLAQDLLALFAPQNDGGPLLGDSGKEGRSNGI